MSIQLEIAKSLTRCKNGGLYYAVFSDIHLGHPHNSAANIVENLRRALPDNAETASLDIIYLAGDVFDDLLMFNDDDIIPVKLWTHELLHICKRNNIELCILEGTPLHDRKQSRYFELENKIHGIGASVRYFQHITIDYMEQFDMHVLYVPDKPTGGPLEVMQTIKDLMRAKGIDQVDMAVMHGMFKFQAPYLDEHNSYDEEAFLQLVKHKIHIGHDHTHKGYKDIWVQGSFDRLGHGYEAPKGHMRFKYQPDGSWDVRFVENTHAMRFDTLNCTGMDIEATLEHVSKSIEGLPDNSYVRIEAESHHPIFTNMEFLIRMNPMINWSKKAVRDKEKALAPIAESKAKFVPITINRENIASLILERIARDGASGAVMDAATELIGDLFPWQTQQPTSPIQPTVVQ